MRLAFISDVHAYAFNDFSKNVNCRWDGDLNRFVEAGEGLVELTLNSRLFNILNGLCDVRDYCVDNNIRLVLNGGDVFHKRSTLDVTTFNCTYKVLESYKNVGIDQIIISGNHDNAINSDNSPSSIETFSNFATVITSPSVVPVWDLETRDVINVCCVPWTKTKHIAIEFMKDCMSTVEGKNILLAHLGLSGASLGSGYVMSDDYSLSELQPNKWKYVLLGHYHKPQVLYENTIYGGSPLQGDFGDEGDHHGFWVIDTSKRWDMELIHLPYPEFITLNSDTIKNYSDAELESNYIRVQTTVKDVDKIQKELEDLGEVRIEIEKEYVKNTRSSINVTMTQEDVIRTYIAESKSDESLDESLLLNKGLEILRKVSGVE